jgi:hypothetical protein
MGGWEDKPKDKPVYVSRRSGGMSGHKDGFYFLWAQSQRRIRVFEILAQTVDR